MKKVIFSLSGLQPNKIYFKYILDLFHAHLFSFETSVVDCILIIICVCVTSIYAYYTFVKMF